MEGAGSGHPGPARRGYRRACAPGLVLASLLACAVRPAEPDDYWSGPIDAPVPATLRGAHVLHTGALRRMSPGHLVLIDVSNAPRRPPELAPGSVWLPPPHADIPGSLWIPGAGLAAVPSDIDALYRSTLQSATGGDRTRAIVVYCHEHCWLSWNAARRAVRYGYRNVWWYPDGVEGWRASGGPTAAVEPTRPAAAAQEARGPGGA